MPEHTGPGHGTCSRRSMQRVPAGPRPLRAGWHRGGRNDLGSAPSVDIANGAPTAADATDQIVLTWVDGRDGLNHEHVMFTTSTDVGGTWAPFRQLEQPGDQGYYSAPAISPDGTDVYAAATRAYGVAVWNDARNGGRLLGHQHVSASSARRGGGRHRASDRAGGPVLVPRCRSGTAI